MPRQTAKLSPDASPFAEKLYHYMIEKGLSVKPWCGKAGVNPGPLFNLFSASATVLDTDTIIKLATVSGPSLFFAVGMSPPPKGELDLDMTTAQKIAELLQALLDTQKDIHEEQRAIRAQNVEIIKRLGGNDPTRPTLAPPEPRRLSKPS